MTNPTPLSPAAQAVIYEYSKVAYDKDIELSFLPLPWERKAAAAALRAAANQLYDSPSQDYLWEIAAELDGTTSTKGNG